MNDPTRHIQNIFIEQGCEELDMTQRIRRNMPNKKVRVLPERCLPEINAGPYPKSLTQGKQHLYLAKNRGTFLKACPATREYCCCDYQVINIGMNCPMDCVYCILQAYLNNPWLSFFVNTDNMFSELTAAIDADSATFHRIGTGEFTDSMALDRITGLSRELIDFFGHKNNAVLELKSKAVVLDNLKSADHNGRTIMAWSLNSPPIMQREELFTASLDERLAAARQCAEWGYKLAFHFDPIIHHPGWQEGYKETIDKLFASVPKEQIVWISLGALRFLPQLKNIADERFPNSRIFHEEFIVGLDNKYRYFRTLRVEMYRHLVGCIKKYASPETCIYFCMESDEIWQEVFGYTTAQLGGLPTMLDNAAKLHCPS